jgi:hypothetical protein
MAIPERLRWQIHLGKKEKQMNTKIEYLYRDASNYKKINQVIVSGTFDEAQKESIQDCLSEGEYFIPRQVGFPEMRFDKLNEDDHCWFELSVENFSVTSLPAEIQMSVEDVVNAFLAAKDNWDDSIKLA